MLTCSFCGKTADETGALLAGPEVNICDNCIAVGARTIETRDALEKPIPTAAELCSTEDETLLSQTAATSALVDRSRDKLQLEIGELRRRGIGWHVIAISLGISHQAAEERFS
ncbi:MAG: ClpX C4-type zinc finger protein [Pseudomonadota bacterium]